MVVPSGRKFFRTTRMISPSLTRISGPGTWPLYVQAINSGPDPRRTLAREAEKTNSRVGAGGAPIPCPGSIPKIPEAVTPSADFKKVLRFISMVLFSSHQAATREPERQGPGYRSRPERGILTCRARIREPAPSIRGHRQPAKLYRRRFPLSTDLFPKVREWR